MSFEEWQESDYNRLVDFLVECEQKAREGDDDAEALIQPICQRLAVLNVGKGIKAGLKKGKA
jgi:hypothetical protein